MNLCADGGSHKLGEHFALGFKLDSTRPCGHATLEDIDKKLSTDTFLISESHKWKSEELEVFCFFFLTCWL